MTTKTKILIGILIIGIILISSWWIWNISKSNLQLTIKSDKEIYRIGESINIELELKNKGVLPIYLVIRRDESCSIQFRIEDEDNWPVYSLFTICSDISAGLATGIKLKAGQSITRNYQVPQTTDFREPLQEPSLRGYVDKLSIPAKEGKYFIQAFYANARDAKGILGIFPSILTWKGSLSSNRIMIEVEKEKQVTIVTDKTEYGNFLNFPQIKKVRIDIYNGLSKEIQYRPDFSPCCGSAFLEKKNSENKWERIYVLIPEPRPAPRPEEREKEGWLVLKPKERTEFEWNEEVLNEKAKRVFVPFVPSGSGTYFVPSGTYRVGFKWYYPNTEDGGTSYSNEFEIQWGWL